MFWEQDFGDFGGTCNAVPAYDADMIFFISGRANAHSSTAAPATN